MNYCTYYTGHVKRETAWLFSAILHGTEHIAFDRTINKAESIFEFFVPADTETIFLDLMEYCKKEGLLLSLEKSSNRLIEN